MFVKEVVVGRRLKPKRLEIKGRGRTGIRQNSISSVTITLEEKPISEFFKLIVTGKCPPGVGYIFKKILFQSDANFEQVKSLSHLTTS